VDVGVSEGSLTASVAVDEMAVGDAQAVAKTKTRSVMGMIFCIEAPVNKTMDFERFNPKGCGYFTHSVQSCTINFFLTFSTVHLN